MPEFQLNGAADPAFSDLDEFTRAYITAMFWTEEQPGSTAEERHTKSGKVRKAWAKRVEEGQQKDMPGDYGFTDLAPKTLARIVADCADFQATHADLLTRAYETDIPGGMAYDESSAGHDFWLTRNEHGVGFWDRGLGEVGDELSAACGWRARGEANPFPGVDVYIGDDLKIYIVGAE